LSNISLQTAVYMWAASIDTIEELVSELEHLLVAVVVVEVTAVLDIIRVLTDLTTKLSEIHGVGVVVALEIMDYNSL
jgi:hypothetical protein